MAKDAALLKKAKYADGMTLAIDPWYLQVWEGVNNADFVNNNNGRTGRATAAAFNNAIGLSDRRVRRDAAAPGDPVLLMLQGTPISDARPWTRRAPSSASIGHSSCNTSASWPDAARGDFGDSFRSQQPVIRLIADEFPYHVADSPSAAS